MSQGFEIILTVDANKPIVKCKLAKSLTDLGLIEAYFQKFKELVHASYLRGQNVIFELCCTCKITPNFIYIYPFHLGIGIIEHTLLILE